MAKKYIAFLDILGFKELVEKTDINKLITIYTKAFEFNYDRSMGIIKYFLDKNAPLHSLIISDSIIIWSEKDDNDSFVALVSAVRFMLFSSIHQGLPLRGSIDIGEVEELKFDSLEKYGLKKSPVILGSGLTEAYILQEKQNWSGCAISDAAISKFKETSLNKEVQIQQLIQVNLLIEYPVPLKFGEIKKYYVVNWPNAVTTVPLTEEFIRKSFSAHNKSATDWSVEYKIKNTLDFFAFANKNFNVNINLL